MKLNLAKVMGLVSVKEGSNVFKQGDDGSLFYIVMQGEADVFVNHMGIQFKACTYNIGGSFGERALIHDEPQEASVRGTSNTLTCFRIAREVFDNLMNERIQALRQFKLFKSLNRS